MPFGTRDSNQPHMASPGSMRRWLQSLFGIVVLCGCTRTAEHIAEGVSDSLVNEQTPSAEHVDLERPIDGAPQLPSMGEASFKSYCAACHQHGGQGVEGRVPPLDNSPWVSGSEDRLVRIVLNGLRGPIEIDGKTYNLEMPAFRMLFKDDNISSILTYVRQRYGAPSPPVTTETVARVRQETQDRSRYGTVEELLQVP